jgi:D-aspartate ligase
VSGAHAGDPPAIVLQASGPNSLGIIRSLARAGVRVIACDHDRRALGLLSRYAAPSLMADPLAEPERFLADLTALAREQGGGVLFATHDEAVAAIGPHEAEIDAVLRRPWSPWERMSALIDKGHQHETARRIGFPVPATVTPEGDGDVVALARDLRFPVILKPRYSPEFRRRFRAQVLEAADPEELRRQWDLAAEYRPQVSEVIPGGDDQLWTLGSYRDAEGRPLGSFTGRKLRQWPPRFGTARAAESHWDPDYAARGHALLDALGFHGISQVETKRDRRDGRDYLIEVNPRSWLWIGLATNAGVNLPYLAWRDAVGQPLALPPGHRGNLRWILATKHLTGSLREIRRGEWSARPFAATLRPPVVDGVLDLRDPRPALALYGRSARAGARRLRRG